MTLAWTLVFVLLAVVFVAIALYHCVRPAAAGDGSCRGSRPDQSDVLMVFSGYSSSFFKKPNIGAALAYLLLYRLAEAQALKLVTPFLLDGREAGGLGLTTQDVGLAYGTAGVLALTVGGILGGLVIARYGPEADALADDLHHARARSPSSCC